MKLRDHPSALGRHTCGTRFPQARQQRRHRAEGDDGFTLIMVMLFVILVGALVLAGMGILLGQIRPTEVQLKNIQTVNSASSGLQAGLEAFRAAATTTGGGVGVRGLLPCTATPATAPADGVHAAPNAVLTGPVGAATDDNRYTVSVRYYATDPGRHSAEWQTLTTNQLSCPLTVTPGYALLTDTGLSSAQPAGHGQRSLQTTYSFATTNAKLGGGRFGVHLYTAGTAYCWDAGSAPTAGTVVTYQSCAPVGTPRQMFTFRPDLSMQWSGGAPAQDLCVDYRGFWPARVSTAMTLQQCATNGTYGAEWNAATTSWATPQSATQSFISDTQWHAAVPSGDFIGQDTNGPYTPGNVKSCLGSGSSTVSAGDAATMNPQSNCLNLPEIDPSTGYGGATGIVTGMPGPSKQVTNYAIGGACLDVLSADRNQQELLVWFCHQAADLVHLRGNDGFSFSALPGQSGLITARATDFNNPNIVDNPTYEYDTKCLTSHGSGARVTLDVCNGSTTQRWVMTGTTGASYADDYLITSGGLCLGLAKGNTKTPVQPYNDAVMQPCTGDETQKWNAPPNATVAKTTSHVETTALGD